VLQLCVGLLPRDAGEVGQRAAPEDSPEDGGVLQERLLALRERVEPRRDDPVQRLGQLVQSPLRRHAHELLREERIAADPREQVRLLLRGEELPVDEVEQVVVGPVQVLEDQHVGTSSARASR
jgi:hypothetical protein